MLVTTRLVSVNAQNEIALIPYEYDKLVINFPCIMSIDGSTNNTGVALLRESDGAICASMAFKRENADTPVAYKVRLKKAIQSILEHNSNIRNIFYEEPFIEYVEAAKSLLMLRTFIEEIKVENEPYFDYLNYKEINNKKWKKLFLEPQVCNGSSELQKKMVRDKLIAALPYLKDISQDEVDAIAMGFVAVTKLRHGEAEELESKKKVKPFQYEVMFIGGDDDEVMLQELYDCYNGPRELLSNGINIVNLGNSRQWFDERVYESIGNEDKLAILKFPSNKHGNIILKYKIGPLAATYQTLYAVVWRKTRKR